MERNIFIKRWDNPTDMSVFWAFMPPSYSYFHKKNHKKKNDSHKGFANTLNDLAG